MREVIVYNVASTTSFPLPAEQYRGYLLGFAVSTEVNDGIPETDTMAMIERQDGRVSMVLPNRIQFAQPHALTAKLAATPANIARACGMENEVEEVSSWPPAPPNGYELANDGDIKRSGYLEWRAFGWAPGISWSVGDRCQDDMLIANPIEVAP